MSLKIAFWGIGVIVGFFVLIISSVIVPRFGLLAAITLVAIWIVVASSTIWLSTIHSIGVDRVWVLAARGVVVLFVVGLLGLVSFFIWFSSFVDITTNSYNVVRSIEMDPAYPYIGFWRYEECNANFGLAIEKAGSGKYYVRFCGPGACDSKSPENLTGIVDDPRYRLLDANLLQYLPRYKSRDTPSIYRRCEQ